MIQSNCLATVKVEYPAIFGEDLRGVRVREDLARNEPIMYIPNKCIISPCHAKDSDIGYLFDSHDNLFEANAEREQNMIIVYMMYERAKGEESFYHPYFEIMDPG